jgi:uncharacterized OB-fold protein
VSAKPNSAGIGDSVAFWKGCSRGELLFQRCDACGRLQFYPRPFCAACHGADLIWVESAKKGRIHSFTIVHRAAKVAFAAQVPFVLAVIELDEGFRMMMNVVGENRFSAAIGNRVRIVFEKSHDGRNLPQAVLDH